MSRWRRDARISRSAPDPAARRSRAIRQKHISRYPAEFAYRFNRRYDLAAMMLPLGWAALRTPPRLWRSLKYEDIYLKGYADGGEARAGVAPWIRLLQRPEV